MMKSPTTQTTQRDERVALQGRVTKLYYSGSRFSAGRLELESGESVSFAGNVHVREFEPVVLHGQWTFHQVFGRQLKATSVEYSLDLSVDGLANYLANNPNIKGIGPAKARRLAEKYGSTFESALLGENWVEIAKQVSVSKETIQQLRKEWQRNKTLNAALTWLASFGLTHHQITTLVQKFGNNAVGILRNNPYLIANEIRGFGFKRIDKIARKVGVPKDQPERIRAGLKHCIDDALNQGHCWIEYFDLIDIANGLLVMDTLDSRMIIQRELDFLLGHGELVEYRSDCIMVAKPEILEMASKLAADLNMGHKSNPNLVWFNEYDAAHISEKFTLNAKQDEALDASLTSSITVISGGAGSGKSHTIAAIVESYQSFDLDVVLCAPTGKAAKRMEEVVGLPAMTIHRLLGYNGKDWNVGPENPIDADVVIVDETGMMDLPLAYRLFRAIDLDRTAVLLVGDHNQLPPVGPGNVLRDLVQHNIVPTVILDRVVRQAGVLKENCTAILQGKVAKNSERKSNGRKPWVVSDSFSDPLDAQRFLLRVFDQAISEKLGYDPLKDVQVLTPTHKGPLGTRELNILLQKLLQKKLFGVEVPSTAEGKRPRILLHDKVIQTRNNYSLDVMNGAIGFVKEKRRDGTLVVDFDGRVVTIQGGSDGIRDLQLAYSLTIHKCVEGNTLLPTENGLLPISVLCNGIEEKNQSERSVSISSIEGIGTTSHFYNGGKKKVTNLKTRAGYEIAGSAEHRVLTASNEGYCWKYMQEIRRGDTLVLRRNTLDVQKNTEYVQMELDSRQVTIDERVGWILGVLIGDGNYSDKKDYRVEVTKGSHDLLLRYISSVQKSFGVRTTVRPVKKMSRYSAYFHNKNVREFLHRCGIDYVTAHLKKVPRVIFESPVSVQASFLQGLYDTDGGVSRLVHFSTASDRLAKEVQLLLLHHGILSRRYLLRGAVPEKNWSEAWRIEVMGSHEMNLFNSKIGFSEEMKSLKLTAECMLAKKPYLKSNWGAVPFGKELIKSFREELRIREGQKFTSKRTIRKLLSRCARGESRLGHLHVEYLNHEIRSMGDTGPAGAELQRIDENGYFFDPVVEISSSHAQVFDMAVPEQHSFIGNGFVNHNCQGSEYPCVISIIHRSHSFQHHRNLFYTAVTRAKEAAYIIGDRWGIENCATTVKAEYRRTFMPYLHREMKRQQGLENRNHEGGVIVEEKQTATT